MQNRESENWEAHVTSGVGRQRRKKKKKRKYHILRTFPLFSKLRQMIRVVFFFTPFFRDTADCFHVLETKVLPRCL
jgi:hypothetical protein